MTLVIPPELLDAVGSVASNLVANLAADKFKDWWKTSAVNRATETTASQFPQYDALPAQLAEWTRRPIVAEALASFQREIDRRPALIAKLVAELGACGFDAAPSDATSLDVVGAFFAGLTRIVLEDEGTTHTVAVVTERIGVLGQDLRAQIDELSSRVGDGRFGHLSAPADDVLADAEVLIREGKAAAALEILRLREKSGSDRYKLLSTRGYALLQLGQREDAEQAFKDARTLNPTRATAVANVGLARLVQDDFSEALTLADQALELEHDNLQALRVRAQALGKAGRWDDALVTAARLPDGGEKEHLIGLLLFWKGDVDEAIKRFLLAHAAHAEDPWLTLRLATALLHRVQQSLERAESAPWGRTPDEAKSDLARGEALLDAAVQLFDQRKDHEGLRESLMQRGQLRATLGKNGAGEDFGRACGVPLPPKVELLEHASDYWNAHGDAHQTLSALEPLRQNAVLPVSLVHRRARALSILDRTDEAIAELRSAASSGDSEATLTLVDLLLGSDDLQGAERTLEQVPGDVRRHWSYALRLAAVQQKRGDEEGALGTLRAAFNEAAVNDRWRLRLAIADALTQTGDWDSAAQEYDQVLTPRSPARLLARLLGSLHNAGRVDRFFELVDAVNAARGVLPEVVEVEAHAREMLGQLPESDALYARLLDGDPNSSQYRLRRAVIAYRRGDAARALEQLPPPEAVRGLPWDDALEAAFLRAWLGDALRALETAYVAYRVHPAHADVQLAYVQLFMSVDPLIPEALNPTTAGRGTWVTVTARGQELVHKLLAPWEEPRHSTEHRAGDDFFTATVGKKVGDSFVLRDDPLGRETVSIVAIRSQYVGAFQEILRTFESTFPGRDGLRGYTFRGAEDLPGIKRILAEKREQGEALAAQFRAMPMPWAMLARLRRTTDIEAWYVVIGNREFHPVLVADGSTQSQASDLRLVMEGEAPVVLETTSVTALAELGHLDALLALGRPLLVAQTVIDQFQQERFSADERLRRGEHMVLEERAGQLYRNVVTEADMRRVRGLWDHVLEWLRDPAKCRICGVEAGRGDVRWSLREMLTPASADSLALARDHGALLLSEDLRLRQLGRTEFQCHGVASLHLLGGLLAKGSITTETHDRAVIRMIGWGYYFVPINDRLLEAAFRDDHFVAGASFRAVADQLSDPTANLPPVVNVAARFIRTILIGSVHSLQRDAALRYLLTTLSRRGDWQLTERLLRASLKAAMVLLPLQLRQVERDIELWKQSRFVV